MRRAGWLPVQIGAWEAQATGWGALLELRMINEVVPAAVIRMVLCQLEGNVPNPSGAAALACEVGVTVDLAGFPPFPPLTSPAGRTAIRS